MARVHELADGAEYPMLIDISNTQAVTRQAKSVFSVKCAAHELPLLAQAQSIVSLPIWYGMEDTSVFLLAFSPPTVRHVRAAPGALSSLTPTEVPGIHTVGPS